MAAIVNDLHKGRDTGPVWGAVIDLSAAVLVFVSLQPVSSCCTSFSTGPALRV